MRPDSSHSTPPHTPTHASDHPQPQTLPQALEGRSFFFHVPPTPRNGRRWRGPGQRAGGGETGPPRPPHCRHPGRQANFFPVPSVMFFLCAPIDHFRLSCRARFTQRSICSSPEFAAIRVSSLGVISPPPPPPQARNSSIQKKNSFSPHSRRWERLWERPNKPFVGVGAYPPLSVACVSTHDSETLHEARQEKSSPACCFCASEAEYFGVLLLLRQGRPCPSRSPLWVSVR